MSAQTHEAGNPGNAGQFRSYEDDRNAPSQDTLYTTSNGVPMVGIPIAERLTNTDPKAIAPSLRDATCWHQRASPSTRLPPNRFDLSL